MRLSNLGFITLLGASARVVADANGFEVIFYDNVDGCNAKDDTTYRILSARGDGTCYTFDKDMPGVNCDQFTKGGAEGPMGCSGPLARQSLHDLPDEGGSCQFFSDENCHADRVSSSGCIDAAATPSKKIGSFQCFGPPARDDCKVAVSRFSRQNAASYLATIEHTITVRTSEDDLPEVPELKQSCWNLVGWGKGCGWNKAEETPIDQGWSMKHEAYSAYKDYSADVQIFGHSCDKTVLKCVGSHSSYFLPNPTNPNGGGETWYLSDTKCALPGEDPNQGLGGELMGQQLLSQLQQEGDTHGFNGDLSTLKKADNPPEPGPYTCEHTDGSATSDQVCPGFWKCVDDAAKITAYFEDGASFEATMTTQPTVAPISSPVCSQSPHPAARSFRA